MCEKLYKSKDIYLVTQRGIENYTEIGGIKGKNYPTQPDWKHVLDNHMLIFGPDRFSVHIRVSPFMTALGRVEE